MDLFVNMSSATTTSWPTPTLWPPTNWTWPNESRFNCDQLQSSMDDVFQGAIYSMYAIIFVVAVIGNSFVCFVVLSSSRMRTVTNYFIMNLAVGDMLITMLCVPFTSVALLKQNWPFGRILCPIVSYSQAVSVFVSAYTLVAISIDKYMVIMWPFKPRISKKLATCVIALVWLVAGVTVLPSFMFATLIQPQAEGNYSNVSNFFVECDIYICQEDFSQVGEWYNQLYTQILMFLQYIIPSVVLLFTYTSIAAVIWCHRIPGEAENTRDQRMARSKRKMIKMMVTVVFVYTLCWLPFNLFMILSDNISDQVKRILFFPLHGLAMSHACYNPIIYCYMNSRFRDELFAIVIAIPGLRRCIPTSYSGGGGIVITSTCQHHIGIEATSNSTNLQRNSTYISMKRKNCTRLSTNPYQQHSNNVKKRNHRHSPSIIEEQM